MSSNELEPAINKKFSMPRWAVAGLSAVALTGILAGCGDENASKTRVVIPAEAQPLGMNFVGSPGLKYSVPADKVDQIDCGYRIYYENIEDRLFGSPEYIPNHKTVTWTNREYPTVVCEGTPSNFTVVQRSASHSS